MSKSIKIYVAILILVFIGTILVDANKKKPIDWSPTYAISDKIPFGLYIFNNEIDAFFKNQKVTKIGQTPYEFLDAHYDYENYNYNVNGTFLTISNTNIIDEQSAEELLYYVSYGNDVVISSNSFPEIFKDSLGFTTTSATTFTDTLTFSINKKQKKYFKAVSDVYFKNIDSTKTTVLGNQITKKEKLPNFIKIKYGSGNFILHTQPITFTNYYLLKDTHYQYNEELLTNISQENIYWYLPSNKKFDSALGYWLSQPALKYAWYLGLISIIIFILFNAKRRQRIIPIKEPIRNTTIDFTKTIGNLYYQEKDYQNLIEKQIVYILEKIRNEYYIDTFNLNEAFITKLHHKTNKDKAAIEQLVKAIKKYRNQLNSSEKDLIDFNKIIEKTNI